MSDVLDIEEVLKREDVADAIKRKADAEASRQVEKFRNETLPQMLEAKATELAEKRLQEMEEKKKNKTPEQIKLEEFEARFAQLEKEKTEAVKQSLYEQNRNKASLMLTEKKLPLDLISNFVTDNEEETVNNVSKLAEFLENFKSNSIQEAVKSIQQPTPSSGSLGGDSSGLSKVNELMRAGKHAEAIKLQKELNK